MMPSPQLDIPGLLIRIPLLVRTLLIAILAGSGMLLLAGGAQAAVRGYATANVNLRAGPGTQYPAVTTLRPGEAVLIHGCLSDRSWCDISVRGERGWSANKYLSAAANRNVGIGALAIPAIVFSYAYWDRYYVRRPWYNTWWGHGRPRPPHRGPGWRPRPPVIGPPGTRPPVVRPPGGRPPGVRPPGVRPPHHGGPRPKPVFRPGRPGRPIGSTRPIIPQ